MNCFNLVFVLPVHSKKFQFHFVQHDEADDADLWNHVEEKRNKALVVKDANFYQRHEEFYVSISQKVFPHTEVHDKFEK
jgi:hypothetical protein